MLEEETSETALHKRTAKISSAAERCSRIVKTFLAMARQRPVSLELISVEEIIDTALDVAAYGLRSSGAMIIRRKAEALPPVNADPDQMAQVFTNLIVNAEHVLAEQGAEGVLQIETRLNRGLPHAGAGGPRIEARQSDADGLGVQEGQPVRVGIAHHLGPVLHPGPDVLTGDNAVGRCWLGVPDGTGNGLGVAVQETLVGVLAGQRGDLHLARREGLGGSLGAGLTRFVHVEHQDDLVEAGQVLAVLDSRELTGLKADFLEAAASERLARVTFKREKQLREDGVTSEAEFLQAEASLVAARAVRQSAETKLHAVGVSHDALATLADLPDGELGRYNVTTPLGGQVLARHIALGEALPAGESGGSEAFVVADDDTVWGDIDVYATDLGRVRAGDVATLHNDEGGVVAEGEIAFITSQLAESSRTATARMILDNPDRRLRPGWFLTARIRHAAGGEGVRVPSAAVYEIEGGPAVFVPVEAGFALRAVSIGAQSSEFVEILSGLEPGDRYVERGAFTLKAELEKGAFGDEHAH